MMSDDIRDQLLIFTLLSATRKRILEGKKKLDDYQHDLRRRNGSMAQPTDGNSLRDADSAMKRKYLPLLSAPEHEGVIKQKRQRRTHNVSGTVFIQIDIPWSDTAYGSSNKSVTPQL